MGPPLRPVLVGADQPVGPPGQGRHGGLPLLALLLGFAIPAFALDVEYRGHVSIPSGTVFEGVLVGGLSSITWDPDTGLYWAISDDRAERGPVRVFALAIDLTDGRLDPGDVRLEGMDEIREEDGLPFAPRSLDPEGLARAPDGRFYVSSEGEAKVGLEPFVAEVGEDRAIRRRFLLPERYRPDGAGGRGVRQNQGFESLTVTPDGRYLVTATENALVQDGPAAAVGVPSPSRVLWLDLDSGRPALERLYWTEPVALYAVPAGGFETAGLVELLALGDERFLALERSYSAGAGHVIRLFLADAAAAEDLLCRESLAAPGPDPQRLRPIAKRLLLDFATLPLKLENFEGLALGPRLPDGRRALIVIADENFDREQRTLVMLLGVGGL
ncbi:MAG TPA: esterase-like activity of phytase family protein [Thermoanaerobaculia bacterium]|nr:esterase-like activity of phytase family protein [Thermoanaerobaculia bacterium]